MRRFWDDRARENAYFFVDDRVDYRRPDVERFWERGEADLQTLLDILGLQIGSTDTVVEIGCGVGRLTRGIALRAARVIAIDVSEEMLSRAQENLEGRDNVELIHGDGTSLTPIGDSIADACVSHVVFQHLPRSSMVMGYVGEMGRVLRPGGWSGFQLSTIRRSIARLGLLSGIACAAGCTVVHGDGAIRLGWERPLSSMSSSRWPADRR